MINMNDKKRQLSSNSTISDLELSLNTTLDQSVIDETKTDTASKEKGKKNKPNKKAKTEQSEPNMSSSMEKKIEEINKKLSCMLTKNDKDFIKNILIDTLEGMKDKIIGHVLHRVEIIEGELMEKENEHIVLKKEIQECKITNKELNEQNNKLKIELEKESEIRKEQNNSLEQYGRRNNIRVSGLDFDNRHENAHDTADGILRIINDKMGLELSMYDIDIAHRLGKYDENKIRPVIVKFVSRQSKYNVMMNTKHLRGTKLSMNEDLTRLNQQVLSSMRLKAKDKVVKAWSFEGKLYLKDKKDKTEMIPYSKYQAWLDLPWPK